MKKPLTDISFDEIKGKSFELINITEMLCELCEKPIRSREKLIKKILFSSIEDYTNLQNRARVHDRAEVDIENRKIYFYDHDFPGEIHNACIEKL